VGLLWLLPLLCWGFLSLCLTRISLSWPKLRFATLSFGAERDFQVKHEASGVVTTVAHKDGHVLHLPFPMNHECLHGVPKRKRVTACRISLTFREIKTSTIV
jgi:hypothetical protein